MSLLQQNQAATLNSLYSLYIAKLNKSLHDKRGYTKLTVYKAKL